ncbi:ferritin-like domain-containing protein [Sphingobacterium sp. E70]|nr:ferritin-like domain-containing protein [Sphingobacterium sp. E70]
MTTIRDHEVAHVNFLKQVLGNKAVSKPTFDFTAGVLLVMSLAITTPF